MAALYEKGSPRIQVFPGLSRQSKKSRAEAGRIPQKEETSPLNTTGFLSESEAQFVEQMRAKGFTFELSLNGEAKEIRWPNMAADLKMMDTAAEWLNNTELSDEEFRKHIRPGNNGSNSITSLLEGSPLFRQLSNEDLLENGNTVSTLEHILLVLEFLQTDLVDADMGRLLRHKAFFHDLGKVVDPNHSSHGIGSAVIARAYYEHANKKALAESRETIYSQEFIDDVAYLCRTHHLFAEIGKLVNEQVSNLIDIERAKERPGLNGRSLADLVTYLDLLNDPQRQEGMIDTGTFKKLFSPYVRDPKLMDAIAVFTTADVQASENHRKYIELNWALLMLLKSLLVKEYKASMTDIEPADHRGAFPGIQNLH